MIKKIFKILTAIILILAATWATVWYGCDVRSIVAGNTVAVLANNIGTFVQSNDGRLPRDWGEFEKWWQSREGKTRWPSNETAKRIEFQSEPYFVSNEVPRYVLIKDPDIKGMEDYVNRRIWSSLQEMKITNVANQAAEATSLRSEPHR